MPFEPERAGGRKRIYSRVPPPQSFITAAMNLSVVSATERHRKFAAYLATERTPLRKAQMVRISALRGKADVGLMRLDVRS